MLGAHQAAMLGGAGRQVYYVPSKPDLWLPLDDRAGTTAYDDSGNGYNATLYNTPTWDVDNQHCLSFASASSEHGIIGDVLDFGTSDLTICAWFKTSSSAAQTILAKSRLGTGAGRYYFGIYNSAGYKLYAGYAPVDGEVGSVYGNTTVNNGVWRFGVAAYDRSDKITLYLDGSANGSGASIAGSDGSNIGNAYSLMIGAYPTDTGTAAGSAYMNGKMAHIMIYKSLLSSSDISAMWAKNRHLFGV